MGTDQLTLQTKDNIEFQNSELSQAAFMEEIMKRFMSTFRRKNYELAKFWNNSEVWVARQIADHSCGGTASSTPDKTSLTEAQTEIAVNKAMDSTKQKIAKYPSDWKKEDTLTELC